jgi:hypothetical protein
MFAPRYTEAGMPRRFVMPPTLHNLYINDTPPPPPVMGVPLARSVDDTSLSQTARNAMFLENFGTG